MPDYALKCSNPACGHKWEAFALARERYALRCPTCGADHADTDFDVQRPKLERQWSSQFGGQEGRSLQLCFDPRGIKDLKKELPSAELDEKTGQLVFRSERHQRRVFKEFNAVRERYRQEQLDEARRRAEEDGEDLAAATAAVEAKFKGLNNDG